MASRWRNGTPSRRSTWAATASCSRIFRRSKRPPTRSAPAAIRGSRRAAHYEPAGIRGDGPTTAARYWGLSQQDYYQKADVWPLNPQGEIFCILQIEDTRGVENLDDMLKNVPGIGCILIGEGDLSQELGYPRQYEHKVVLEWMKRIVDTCKKHKVVVGHPHVERTMSSASSLKATAS